MSCGILVSARQLNELIHTGDCVVVDCRFDLSDPERGRAEWLAGHIPGAVYGNLDQDLAAPVEAHTGRHPLPSPGHFSEFLASTGWSGNQLLVAYDEQSNAIAARLWWMMRYFGQRAALLDGGLAAWIDAGLPLEAGARAAQPADVKKLGPGPGMTVTAEMIGDRTGTGECLVLDARARERYSGEVENLDTKAGHIPGAINRPFGENLDDSGHFRKPDQLRAEFRELLGPLSPETVVHSCGSGVTACHNLFSMELAGLSGSRLYPGSWSEWIRDPARPVSTGNDP